MPQFIGTEMTRGFAGMLTRGYYDNTTEVLKNDTTAPVTAYGVAVKLNTKADSVTPTAATGDAVYGFSVREYGQAYRDETGKIVENKNLVTVLKRGYIAVKVTGEGTAARGGKVYLDASGAITASDSAATAVPGAIFMGPADADGLVEIAYNI